MAYILMSGQDIRKLAVNVNAKQSQGFIPAGGLSYKDGTFYQFMAPTDIPDPASYGIVMAQSDLDFAARAALMPGAPLGTMIQHNAFFIQAFGTAVSDSGMIQIPLAVANGGTGATTAAGARGNLAIDRFDQQPDGTKIYSPSGTHFLTVGDDGFVAATTFRGRSITLDEQLYPSTVFKSSAANTAAVGGNTSIEVNIGTNAASISTINFIRRRLDAGSGPMTVSVPQTGGTLALQGTSGLEYKKDITDADATEAMDRIRSQRLVNFVYKDDEQARVRFGIIAEEAEVVAPQYIKHNDEPYEDILDEEGNKIGEKTRDRPSVDTNPIVMDLMGCVQVLHAKIAALEAEIADLKSGK